MAKLEQVGTFPSDAPEPGLTLGYTIRLSSSLFNRVKIICIKQGFKAFSDLIQGFKALSELAFSNSLSSC